MSAGRSNTRNDGAIVQKTGGTGDSQTNAPVKNNHLKNDYSEHGTEKLQSVIIATGDSGRGAVNGKFRTEIYSPTDTSPSVEFAGGENEKSNTLRNILKFLAILCFLYMFVCSLDILSSSFRIISGRAAGEIFHQQKLLSNPIVGVMIGILVTVAVQSSSTSTSIVVSLVASGIVPITSAIPIVMGANIGTSVTNTIVALTHISQDDGTFERAFAGSVLHDMFNILAVTTLLVLEVSTGYLERTTTALLNNYDFSAQKGGGDIQILSVITKPFTSLIVQMDKSVIIGWSLGDEKYDNASILKKWCNKTQVGMIATDTIIGNISNASIPLHEESGTKCKFIFNFLPLSDVTVGVILLVASLTLLCGCLICLVKVLSTMLKGKLAIAVQKGVNADVPYLPCLTGYLAMGIGAVMTVCVQSSSVFTSAMTPLIAVGMISLDRAYPLTLGSNLGTTTTAMLAAFTTEGPNLRFSIQLAMCHFLFNLTGILLFYPIPFMRFPIRMAEGLGRVTAKYRWFAVFYLIFAFIMLPLMVFALSLIGAIAFYIVSSVFGLIFVVATVINLMQDYAPDRLPLVYRNWNFLPLWFHSLEPYDRIVQKLINFASDTCCTMCCRHASTSSRQESREIIKMKQSHSSLGGLDNLGFIRGDQIDETTKNPPSPNTTLQKKHQQQQQQHQQHQQTVDVEDDVEQTQL